ncbi:hypothetical protein, partial [Phytoactinopolyspora endophytica]|uniref:hypothetical protein n=1 Tax=Phytoactinopolyspora endophytica TaxID=1642495 RepID=UPI0013ECB2F9
VDDERRFALLVAAVSVDGRLAPLLTVLSGTSAAVRDWLVDEHLEVSDGMFRLREPALGSVIWHATGMQEHVRAHELLAEAYQERDPGQVMWHRALAELEYDDGLAADLQRTASEMLTRGEFDRAVEFAREAYRLTSDSHLRRDRLLQSGTFAMLAGRCDEAIAIARERVHMEMSTEHSTKLALLEARARILGDRQVPAELVDSQANLLADSNVDAAAQFWLVAAAGFADRFEPGEARRYLALVEKNSDALSEQTWGIYRRTAAWVAALVGEAERARALIETDSVSADVLSDAEQCIRHAMVLTRLEMFSEARDLLRVITEQRRFGSSP